MKQNSILKFNLDVFAKPVNVSYNDEVVDITQAKQFLKKFMLGDKDDSTIRKNENG